MLLSLIIYVECTPHLCMKPWTTQYVNFSDTFMYYNRHTATVHVYIYSSCMCLLVHVPYMYTYMVHVLVDTYIVHVHALVQ